MGENSFINKIAADSDVICLMISYSAENINFIDYNKILKMKDGVVFINTSRGEMVNETDLIKALKIGKISSAGLDVLNDDSIWSGKLKKVPEIIEYAKTNSNLVITPHMGGYGDVSINKTRRFILTKFLNTLENETNNNSWNVVKIITEIKNSQRNDSSSSKKRS